MKFEKEYNRFIIVMGVFFTALYAASVAVILGYQFNFNYIVFPFLAVVLYFAGSMMQESKRNYFIGIRTPWTLASDKVWKKTNELGGSLFKSTAAVLPIAMFFSSRYIVLLALILGSAAVVFIYSYIEYKN